LYEPGFYNVAKNPSNLAYLWRNIINFVSKVASSEMCVCV